MSDDNSGEEKLDDSQNPNNNKIYPLDSIDQSNAKLLPLDEATHSNQSNLTGHQSSRTNTNLLPLKQLKCRSILSSQLTEHDNEKLDGKMLDRHNKDLLNYNMKSARGFFEETLFDISLERLYSLQYASNFAHYDKYCAVVLKLGVDMLKTVNNSYYFLFLVYEKGGNCISKEYL